MFSTDTSSRSFLLCSWCFRQTPHLDRACCVFDRHIISIDHVVFSTDTPSCAGVSHAQRPLTRPGTTPFNTGRCACNIMLCFRQTHHLDRSCCVAGAFDRHLISIDHVVFSTDNSSRSIMLCFLQTHPDAVTIMRWRIACPTPVNTAWYDAL